MTSRKSTPWWAQADQALTVAGGLNQSQRAAKKAKRSIPDDDHENLETRVHDGLLNVALVLIADDNKVA